MNYSKLIRGSWTLGLLVVLFVTGGGLPIPIPGQVETWRGTAPFCEGRCLPGEKEVRRSKCGDGSCCWTGSKALCRGSAPTCQALQTNVACKGVVLLCDNGFYTQKTNVHEWHSCSKSVCGACIGWWSDWKEPVKETVGGAAGVLSPLSLRPLARNRNTTLPNLPYGPDTCKQGFVWREAIKNDHVCVLPKSRSQAADDNKNAVSRREPNGGAFGPDTCKQGFVWREVVPTDRVCVTPQIRKQTRIENSQFEVNRARGSLW